MANVPSTPPSLPVPRRLPDPEAERFRSDAHVFFTALTRSPLLWGAMVRVTLAAGVATRVRHGLPRPPTGYIVVRRSAAANLFDAAVPVGQSSDDTVWLQSDANCTYTVWFF